MDFKSPEEKAIDTIIDEIWDAYDTDKSGCLTI